MFKLEGDILYITLPEGKTQAEILEDAKRELLAIEEKLYGLELKLNGRITTSLALYLGHRLAHICKSVSIFDPKENSYILAVSH